MKEIYWNKILNSINKIYRIKQILKKMEEYQIFLESIDFTLDNVIKLLGSKSLYDITESIKLIMVLNKYGIEKSE